MPTLETNLLTNLTVNTGTYTRQLLKRQRDNTENTTSENFEISPPSPPSADDQKDSETDAKMRVGVIEATNRSSSPQPPSLVTPNVSSISGSSLCSKTFAYLLHGFFCCCC